jgi:hypothetical protein
MTSQAMHDLIATATKALSHAGATGVIIIIDGATEPRTLLAEPQSRGEGSLAACETETQPGSAHAVRETIVRCASRQSRRYRAGSKASCSQKS